MSAFGETPFARAGRLACLCGDYFAPSDRTWRQPGTAHLAIGFAASVLAQALGAGVLPLAGYQIGPGPAWTGVPFAAMLLGAVIATFPASHLLDRFGRRAAFALGASMGAAGGLIAAYALVSRDFSALCLGAFWLGVAQGFGLFYRHAAALAPGATPKASAIIFGAGALAGLAGPWIAQAAEGLFSPVLLLGTVLAAAAVQVAALALAVTIPEPPVSGEAGDRARPMTVGRFVLATLLSAAGWTVMVSCMVGAPLAMLGCGIALGGIAGAVAWHLIAMYAPALFVGRVVTAIGTAPAALCGLSVALAGAAWVAESRHAAGFSAGLILVGAGWAVTATAATLHLHAAGRPRPLALAAHDALCLCAALAAALVTGAFA